MITRRTFLIGAGSALTLSIVDKFVWHLDNKGLPLIHKPENPSEVLFVDRAYDYEINTPVTPPLVPASAGEKSRGYYDGLSRLSICGS